MKLSIPLLLCALAVPAIAKDNLRAESQRQSLTTRKHKKANAEECTLMVKTYLWADANLEGTDEVEFACAMDAQDMNGVSNINRLIELSNKQKSDMKKALKEGRLIPGKSTLKHGNAFYDDKRLFISYKLDVSSSIGNPKKNESGNANNKRRHLVTTTGTKPILVVRVIDSEGKAVPQDAATVGDDVFGTLSDPNNLASQMKACSFDALDVVPGPIVQEKEAAPGVIEVTIPGRLEDYSGYEAEADITAAVQAYLGITLPGPYQHVMYVIENCYDGCGYAAYAYINSWLSLYCASYYRSVGVQMHEIGHNFGFAHSGGLDGATYTDHTGYMGNPCYGDDNCEICFNAVKNW
jgi:hypothetical protein